MADARINDVHCSQIPFAVLYLSLEFFPAKLMILIAFFPSQQIDKQPFYNQNEIMLWMKVVLVSFQNVFQPLNVIVIGALNCRNEILLQPLG